MQIEIGDTVRRERKQVRLDLLGDGDLVLQAFLFFLFHEQTLQRSRHLVERAAQLGELVVAFDADTVVQIAAVDMLSRPIQVGHRGRNRPAQTDRHPQGQQLDESKDQAQENNGDAQDAGDDSSERRAEELVIKQRGARFDGDENSCPARLCPRCRWVR